MQSWQQQARTGVGMGHAVVGLQTFEKSLRVSESGEAFLSR
jgi:hypothetical protein